MKRNLKLTIASETYYFSYQYQYYYDIASYGISIYQHNTDIDKKFIGFIENLAIPDIENREECIEFEKEVISYITSKYSF